MVSCIAPRTWLLSIDRFARRGAQALGDVAQRIEQRRRDDEDDKAEQRVLNDHDAEQSDEGQKVARRRGDRQVHDVADAGDVLADPRGDLRRPRLAEEADRQRHQMRVKPALVAGDDVVADLGEDDRLEVAGETTHHKRGEDRRTNDPRRHRPGARRSA